MDIKIIFASTSVIVGLLAFLPYFKDVFAHKTKPHAFTWLIWAITQGTATAALLYGGGGLAAIPLIISVSLTTAVFFLSLREGAKNITRSDIFILAAALTAIFIWWFLDNPLLAVLMASGIDLIGYIPTFRKSYTQPQTETTWSWAAFTLANGLALLALESYNLLTMSYLVSITSANLVLLIFLLIRRQSRPVKKTVIQHLVKG